LARLESLLLDADVIDQPFSSPAEAGGGSSGGGAGRRPASAGAGGMTSDGGLKFAGNGVGGGAGSGRDVPGGRHARGGGGGGESDVQQKEGSKEGSSVPPLQQDARRYVPPICLSLECFLPKWGPYIHMRAFVRRMLMCIVLLLLLLLLLLIGLM
jgi:hypothetical protein